LEERYEKRKRYFIKDTKIGIYYYANGNKYDGMWKDDNKDGRGNSLLKPKGILYYANKDKYDGEWEDGNMSGRGIKLSKYRNVLL